MASRMLPGCRHRAQLPLLYREVDECVCSTGCCWQRTPLPYHVLVGLHVLLRTHRVYAGIRTCVGYYYHTLIYTNLSTYCRVPEMSTSSSCAPTSRYSSTGIISMGWVLYSYCM